MRVVRKAHLKGRKKRQGNDLYRSVEREGSRMRYLREMRRGAGTIRD
ncbi:MAG: hypothetical protein ACFFAS_02615 [Promethearchaeota archaeon]